MFVNASVSNSTFIDDVGLPLYNVVEFIMNLPYARAYVVPTCGIEYIGGIAVGTQGVPYYL